MPVPPPPLPPVPEHPFAFGSTAQAPVAVPVEDVVVPPPALPSGLVEAVAVVDVPVLVDLLIVVVVVVVCVDPSRLVFLSTVVVVQAAPLHVVDWSDFVVDPSEFTVVFVVLPEVSPPA